MKRIVLRREIISVLVVWFLLQTCVEFSYPDPDKVGSLQLLRVALVGDGYFPYYWQEDLEKLRFSLPFKYSNNLDKPDTLARDKEFQEKLQEHFQGLKLPIQVTVLKEKEQWHMADLIGQTYIIKRGTESDNNQLNVFIDKYGGVDVEIANEVVNRINNNGKNKKIYKLIFVPYLSFKEVLDAMKFGEADLLIHSFNQPDRASYLLFLNTPHIWEKGVLFCLKEKQGDIDYENRIDQLKNYRLAYVKGYSHGKAFDEARQTYLKKMIVPVDTETEQIEKLRDGFAEVAIGNEPTIRTIIETEFNSEIELYFFKTPIHSAPNFFAFSRFIPNDLELVNLFNHTLISFQTADRTKYEQIIEKNYLKIVGSSGNWRDLIEPAKTASENELELSVRIVERRRNGVEVRDPEVEVRDVEEDSLKIERGDSLKVTFQGYAPGVNENITHYLVGLKDNSGERLLWRRKVPYVTFVFDEPDSQTHFDEPDEIYLGNRLTKGDYTFSVKAVVDLANPEKISAPQTFDFRFVGSASQLYIALGVVAVSLVAFLGVGLIYTQEKEKRLSQKIKHQFTNELLGVIEWNQSFNVVSWNRAAEEIFDWSEEEAQNEHAKFIVPEGAWQEVEAVWQALMAGKTGSGQHSVNENKTKYGRKIKCLWYNTPLRQKLWYKTLFHSCKKFLGKNTDGANYEGDVIGVYSLVLNLTPFVDMVEHLRQVAAKIRTISESDEKTGLIPGYVHDIRNLVHHILIEVEELGMDLELENNPQYVSLERNANRTVQLAQDILDTSKDAHLDNDDFDLLELIDDLSNQYRTAVEKDRLIVEPPDNRPILVRGDRKKIDSVLMNLLGNAMKHARSKVILRVFPDFERGDFYQFEVEDDGIGIPIEKQKKIFEIYYSEGLGFGIGLSQASQLVRLMHGELQVESNEGQGARFYFSIPLSQTNQQGDSKVVDSSRRVVGLAAGQPHIKALVVEDDERIRNVLSRRLSRINIEVLEAAERNQAVDCALEHRPDIIFMDIDLSDESEGGVEAAQQIRQALNEREQPKIVAVSRMTSKSCLPVFDKAIPKPYTRDQIYSALVELLGVEFEFEPMASSEPVDFSEESLPREILLSLKEAAQEKNASKVKRCLDRVDLLDEDRSDFTKYLRFRIANMTEVRRVLDQVKEK